MATSPEFLKTEELYLEHHRALHRFLTRMLRCEEAAAEVAQDVYVRLLRLAPQRPVENPRGYLFRVAANAAYDRMARDRRRERVMDDQGLPDTLRCPLPDAEAITVARERLNMLAEAVNELPPRCREVFLMSRLDGLSHAEIAGRLAISRNMVEKHIIKAMLYCRRRIDGE